jgi:hypothetical protein
MRHCPRCNTTKVVEHFDGIFCVSCRLPEGTLGEWSKGTIIVEGGWTYPAEAKVDLPEGLKVRVAKFLPQRRYGVVPVSTL